MDKAKKTGGGYQPPAKWQDEVLALTGPGHTIALVHTDDPGTSIKDEGSVILEGPQENPASSVAALPESSDPLSPLPLPLENNAATTPNSSSSTEKYVLLLTVFLHEIGQENKEAPKMRRQIHGMHAHHAQIQGDQQQQR